MRRGKSGRNGLLPNSLRIISSCLKTVSSNAGSVASTVRSAGASVAASIAVPPDDEKDQVLWAGFDKLELNSTSFKNVLLLGYSNGFQVLDVGDASNVRELVSKRDGPVTFLQMQPIPAISEGPEGFRSSHPMLLIVAGDETNGSGVVQGGRLSALIKDNGNEAQPGNCISAPTVVRFFSLRYNGYVHVLRFRSAVYVVRCSPRIVAVALAAQIYCFDATTLENKFSVLTYPVQGAVGEIGYGPMAVGPRWLAYASNNPLTSNTVRLSPQNLSPSPGVSPSTSPGNGSLVARYAMESSKHLAAGIINLGDMGYKTISKYCQDLLPDGSSSPTPSNSGRKVGRIVSSAHASETDNAGMVVVKDFVSKDVVAQFRAHTSPISALCFDPSGTLLVTTSVHGNNINIFRIMPNLIHNGSSSARYDWNTSHVHLYKLYRGLTTAIIQDISFSHYSQWISIISSRGTCHIYVLSPFGGDVGLQTQNLYGDGPVLVPNLSMPWWSASSCKMDHHFFPPPPPTTLSVVSRIKNGNSGWLNTVSSVAASAAGKTLAPSGAIAAVFHNSVCTNYQEIINSKVNSLEHLLVYSPSGHVIQHELLPSSVAESFDSTSRIGPGSHLQLQDEELRVKAEPVQWWDVCRRSNWPERDECMSGIVDKHETSEMIVDASDCEENETKYTSSLTGSFSGKDLVKAQEKTRWYLSNAEVKGTSGRIPIWQKSKICFYTMSLPKYDLISIDGCNGGESEVEKIPVHEVEIRQKDLLPVFQHFHNVQSDWRDRDPGGRCLASSVAEHAKDKSCQDTGIQHSSFASRDGILLNTEGIDSPILHGRFLSVEEPGYRRAAKNPDMMNGLVDKVDASVGNCTAAMSLNITGRIVNQNQESEFYLTNHSHNDDSSIDGQAFNGSSGLSSVGSPVNQGIHLNNGLSSDSSTLSGTLVHSLQNEGKGSQDALEFGLYVQEGYCKLSELDDCQDSTEAVTDADSSSSHCGRDRPEDDADNDEILLGGVFAFSEEG